MSGVKPFQIPVSLDLWTVLEIVANINSFYLRNYSISLRFFKPFEMKLMAQVFKITIIDTNQARNYPKDINIH